MNDTETVTAHTPTATLAAGLVRAQREAHAVAKGGRNKFHGYNYASAEDVIRAARDALSEGDLAILAMSHEIATMIPGGPEVEPTLSVRIRYALIHAAGESREITSETPIMPEKGRPWDKALAAAKTYDLSYMLRSLLLLPRGEDEASADVDNRDDRGWDKRRQGGGGDRAPAKAPPREPERPAEATAKTPPPAAPVRDEAFAAWWAGMQEAGYTADATKALAARMFSVDSPRKLTPDQRAAVLTEARRAGAPERDMSGARPVLDEAREVAREAAEAAAEQQDVRRQQRAARGAR
jgi:hypothetical protein